VSDRRWNEEVRELIEEIESDIGRPKRGLLIMSSAVGLILLALIAYAFFKSPPGIRVLFGGGAAAQSSPSPSPTPTASPPPTAGADDPKPAPSVGPSPTQSRTPRPKPTRRPTPLQNPSPEGNCNQRDEYNGLCEPTREEN
jgi:hypothetical protein